MRTNNFQDFLHQAAGEEEKKAIHRSRLLKLLASHPFSQSGKEQMDTRPSSIESPRRKGGSKCRWGSRRAVDIQRPPPRQSGSPRHNFPCETRLFDF